MWFEGLGPESRSFLIYQPTIFNQEPIVTSFWSFTLLKERTETIKNSKHLPKINRVRCIAVLSATLNGFELVFSLHNRAENELEVFV